MGWFNSSNFLTPTCSAQPKRWHDVLVKLDFNVIQDLFMTPTAMACGDVFLPMSTWAEHDGIVITHYGRNTVFMSPINKTESRAASKSEKSKRSIAVKTGKIAYGRYMYTEDRRAHV